MPERHYHLVMGPVSGPSIGECVYDTYEDSVFHFTEMSRGIFGHLFKDEDDITIEKVIFQTEHGDAGPTVIGTPRLCVFWFTCDNCELMNAN